MRSIYLFLPAAVVLLGCGLDGPAPHERTAGAPQKTESPATNSPTVAGTASISGDNNDASDRTEGFVSTIDVNALGDRPPWKAFAPGVDTIEVSLKIPAGSPGNADRLLLYVPHGQHARHSLGCVFVAPAGAPIFAGNSLGDGDRAEHVPYVRAGYAVAAFEIDGTFDDAKNNPANILATYSKFKAAAGGVVNGKNALEYVLAKLPEVDPERLYAAGHSSAAIWALLFAEHEPRIKACIAYAPLADLFGRAPAKRAAVERAFPGIARLSPQEGLERLKCPVFLFHAEDDHNIPIGLTRRFVELLKQSNADVTFHTVPTGDHYQSMIAEGIPQGIKWLTSLPAEAKARQMTSPVREPQTTRP